MRYYTFQNETKDYLNRLERENGLRISGIVAKSLNDRVELLKKSGVWARYGLGFNDVDGDAYLARANVTNVMGRGEVLWFVRGMKSLGLYSNMVAWPMRDYQNVGSGSTVYSLGGLGIFNLTLINSPTWDTNWMSFIPVNSYAAAVLPTTFNTFSILSSTNTINTSPVFSVFGCGTIPFNNTNMIDFTTTSVGNNRHLIFGDGSTFQTISPRLGSGTRFFGVTTSGNNGTISAFQDDLQISSNSQGTANPSLINFTLAKRFYDAAQSRNVQHSFVFVITTNLSLINYNLIRNLYKSTLGNNLTLP
jgi:hypothetical protein